MTARYSIFILWTFFIFSGCQPDTTPAAANKEDKIIEAIRQKYAPDKRVAIFNVSFKNGVLKGETNLPDARTELLDSLQTMIRTDSLALLNPAFGIVNVSVCNIRSEPRHSAELATQSLLGTVLRIYKEQANWYYVQTPDGYLGWLDDGGFVKTTAEVLSRWQLAKKVVVKSSFEFIYRDLKNTVLSDVVAGNILESGDRFGNHREVKLPDGRTGLISETSIVPYEDFIRLQEPLLDNILSTAHHMMGRPYLWGGTSGKGMDCSGFTKTVYYLNALELPRDASQQVNVGIEVETDTTLKNLLIGDLLFFGQKRPPLKKSGLPMLPCIWVMGRLYTLPIGFKSKVYEGGFRFCRE